MEGQISGAQRDLFLIFYTNIIRLIGNCLISSHTIQPSSIKLPAMAMFTGKLRHTRVDECVRTIIVICKPWVYGITECANPDRCDLFKKS